MLTRPTFMVFEIQVFEEGPSPYRLVAGYPCRSEREAIARDRAVWARQHRYFDGTEIHHHVEGRGWVRWFGPARDAAAGDFPF